MNTKRKYKTGKNKKAIVIKRTPYQEKIIESWKKSKEMNISMLKNINKQD